VTTSPDATARDRLVWRFSPIISAIAFLVACACAAGDLYGHPGLQPRIAMIVVGLIAVYVGVATVRMALVVDREGIAVRSLLASSWIPWPEVQAIDLVTVRGSETIRIIRVNDSYIDVPASLLQPVWPTTKPRAMMRRQAFVAQINALGQSAR
jgi:hypothetical protein